MENSKEKKIKIPEVATVNHAHHRQRLYARIAEVGLERCDDLTILEFILTLAIPRVDTNPIAHRLMDRFGSISAVLDASPLQLQEIRGIGPRAARLLSFFPQLCNCYNKIPYRLRYGYVYRHIDTEPGHHHTEQSVAAANRRNGG